MRQSVTCRFFAEGTAVDWSFWPSAQFPSIASDVFEVPHVRQELIFDLTGPDYDACYGGYITHLGHVIHFKESVLCFELHR